MKSETKKLIILLSAVTVCLLGLLGFLVSRPPVLPISLSAQEEELIIPEYTGEPYTAVHNNRVFFDTVQTASYFELAPLDVLGRCQEAKACIGPDTLTYDERGSMGMIKPSGWNTARYDDLIEDMYLFNRCHLLGYALTGIEADARNLITGTRYMNIHGMLEFEVQVARYVQKTGNHVEYHVRPVFVKDELVCRGVLMQAQSVEDRGVGLEFCVYCFNVQPGIIIDYKTGESQREEALPSRSVTQEEETYVLNTNTHRFHRPDCESVAQIKEKNKKTVTAYREDLIEQGYIPCGVCSP